MRLEKVIEKIIPAVLACVFLVSILPAVPAFAAGSVYVDQTYVEIEEGSTVTVLFTAQNAAGSYSVSSEGCASANGGGWLDNESVSIGIYGASVGSGSVTIYLNDFATYDEEELSDPITSRSRSRFIRRKSKRRRKKEMKRRLRLRSRKKHRRNRKIRDRQQRSEREPISFWMI